MDIYSAPGTKVKAVDFRKNIWGDCDQADGLLVPYEEYTIDYTEVHSSYTRVFLVEVPGKKFNSTVFE